MKNNDRFPLNITVKNLHIHLDERMNSKNFYHAPSDDVYCGCSEDGVEVDMDELVQQIRKDTGLPTAIIERVLTAENDFLAKKGIVEAVDEEDSAPEDSADIEDTAKDGDKSHAANTNEMKDKVMPVLAGMAMLRLMKTLSEAEKKEDSHGSDE